jgi:hypothetical protein
LAAITLLHGSTVINGARTIYNALTIGTDNSAAGTLQLANGSANAHTIFGSGATTTNTIKGFATVPTTGDIVTCTVSGTTCTLTDGGAPSSGSLVLLEQHTANATSPNLDFTTCFSSTYDTYQFQIIGIVPGATSDLYMRISTDGGMNFITTGNYFWAHWTNLTNGTNGGSQAGTAAQIQITDATRMVTTAGTSTNGTIWVSNMLNGTKFTTMWGNQMGWVTTTLLSTVNISGGYGVANTANAIRFLESDGNNLASGTIRCYGIAK